MHTSDHLHLLAGTEANVTCTYPQGLNKQIRLQKL